MKAKEAYEPAAAELRRYIGDAGPAVASEGPAPGLLRECEQIILATRQAADAAREMKGASPPEKSDGTPQGAPK